MQARITLKDNVNSYVTHYQAEYKRIFNRHINKSEAIEQLLIYGFIPALHELEKSEINISARIRKNEKV